MKITHFMVGDEYVEEETGERYKLTAIGTGEMSGRKRITSNVDGLSLWVTDEELEHRFQFVSQ